MHRNVGEERLSSRTLCSVSHRLLVCPFLVPSGAVCMGVVITVNREGKSHTTAPACTVTFELLIPPSPLTHHDTLVFSLTKCKLGAADTPTADTTRCKLGAADTSTADTTRCKLGAADTSTADTTRCKLGAVDTSTADTTRCKLGAADTSTADTTRCKLGAVDTRHQYTTICSSSIR
jgi:hypothetical protein